MDYYYYVWAFDINYYVVHTKVRMPYCASIITYYYFNGLKGFTYAQNNIDFISTPLYAIFGTNWRILFNDNVKYRSLYSVVIS